MARGLEVFILPYDSGRKGERLGKGPDAFLQAGLVERLRGQGHTVNVARIELEQTFPLEVTTAFELASRLSRGVRSAMEAGRFPLVLAGNCFSAMGTVSGVGQTDLGIAWFDCHGDFHTPDTSPSGFLDGMAIAAVNGRCWAALAKTVPAYAPVAAEQIVHLGGRDFDAEEREAMVAAGINVCGVDKLRTSAAPTLPGKRVYLHLDLDTLDPREGRVNSYQTAKGLTANEIEGLLRQFASQGEVVAAAVTAYEPDGDREGRAGAAGLRLIECLAELGSKSA
jgi:arginase